MSNKSEGSKFERELCDILYDQGFWVHNFAQNQAGQPADIIAVRQNTQLLIDCKVCANNSFPLSRIEDNQHLAMREWSERTFKPTSALFALKDDDGIFFFSYSILKTLLKCGGKRLTRNQISSGLTLEDMIEIWGRDI